MLSLTPWMRCVDPDILGSRSSYFIEEHSFRNKFGIYEINCYADIYTKRAAFAVSASVVSLRSYAALIIECEEVNGTFSEHHIDLRLCCRCVEIEVDNIEIDVYLEGGKICEGQVVAHDFHYNIAAIKIHSDVALKPAVLKHIDDSITIDPGEQQKLNQEPHVGPLLRPHSNSYKVVPGDKVIAVGRHFTEPYMLMAAAGLFSMDACKLSCKELLRANCRITKEISSTLDRNASGQPLFS
ncbi:hypothetical protein Dimus_005032 [Dionaea muscipula]